MVKSFSVALFALWAFTTVTANPILQGRATECYGDCVTRCNAKSDATEKATCLTGCASKAACTTTVTTTTTKTTSASTKTTTTTTKAATAAATTAASGTVPTGLVGYATQNGGTTGGSAGSTTTVSSAAAFVTAATSSGAKVIYLNGFFSNVGEIKVASDKTIIGVGANSGFTGSSLVLKSVSNIIIRNIKMQLCQGGDNDCITINAAKNIWIDHNDLSGDLSADKDTYDGLVDITHGSTFITVSWNYFHNHHKTSLVGHSDSNEAEDVAIRVTYYANYFQSIGSRTPSVRFGTVHVFSNYYNDIQVSGINTRMNAQLLIESNVFVNAVKPATFLDSDVTGYCVLRNNDFGGATADCPTGTLTSVPYSYTVIATANVKSTVSAGAGTGKI